LEFVKALTNSGNDTTRGFGPRVGRLETAGMRLQMWCIVLVLFRESEWVLSDGLGDGTGANQANGDSTGDHGTVFDNLNFLEVAAVDSLGDARGFTAVASEVLCFTAFRLFVAATGLEVAVEINKSGAFDAFVLFQSAHWGCALTEKKSRAGRMRINVIREKIGGI
jgi:hypothetical protein